ncbi:MAG: FAD-dependent oxidoreductase [Actinobacteria bacterium]|nr:FAD-dependent oxidoreductase [Actinomycetota bacterium]
MEKVDVIVIGSGQGGVPAAVKLAWQGKQVVLFEKGALGGSCPNYGCYPSKAFLGAAFTIPRRDRAGLWGIDVTTRVDSTRLMERVRSKLGARHIKDSLDRAGVRTVMAAASFTAERTVSAGGDTYEAQTVIINTGNGPFVPPIPGLDRTPFMTYIDFWQLKRLPPRIIILGGGYIGVELGQGLARLGAETHIVELQDRIVAHEDAEISSALKDALESDGVIFHLGRKAERVDHEKQPGHEQAAAARGEEARTSGGEQAGAAGVFTVTLDSGEKLQAEALLAVVGQRPNTAELDAAAGGIELSGRGFITVNDRFETSCPGVYAIGDVTGQPAFTHVAWEDHRRLLSILEGGDRRQGDRVLGYAFFTDPEVGRCGMTLTAAKEKGLNARSATLELEHVARPWLLDETRGFFQLVIDSDSEKILGATLICPRAGDLVHCIIDLMEAGAGWRVLEKAVHIHPAFAEGLPTLARKFLKGS